MKISFVLITVSLILRATQSSSGPLILSDYIKQNRLSEAKSLSEVKGLPNAPQIQSYSGFLTVDHKYNSYLFFWFFPSFKNPTKAPVVIWLEGGPGGSSLWSLFAMNGPFKVQEDMNVTLNPYSLTQEFSVLYIDNPIGTGFSFTDDERGYSTDMTSVADNLYVFLEQFYQIFSEYRDNELYISGESYAGKYCPALGYKLMQMPKVSRINFKGIAIGNGWTDPINQLDGFVYLKSTGLIDKRQQVQMQAIENKIRESYHDKDYAMSAKYLRSLFNSHLIPSLTFNSTGYSNMQNFLISGYSWEDSGNNYFKEYLELNETRRALHVEGVKYWVSNATVYQMLANDTMLSVMDNMTALIPHYKIMLFVGNLDMTIGPAQIDSMLENKDWKYYQDYYSAKRVIWKVANYDTEVAGYAKSFGNFTQVIVRNAGHSVALDQPRSNLDLFARFINDLPFDSEV